MDNVIDGFWFVPRVLNCLLLGTDHCKIPEDYVLDYFPFLFGAICFILTSYTLDTALTAIETQWRTKQRVVESMNLHQAQINIL